MMIKKERSERPWGYFERYTYNQRSTVKIHTIRKGHKSSLQSHSKRTEFFIVLDHGIVVEVDGKRFNTKVGDEVHVPIGSKHRFSSEVDGARILEISLGEFIEDDIIRYEDDYGRI